MLISPGATVMAGCPKDSTSGFWEGCQLLRSQSGACGYWFILQSQPWCLHKGKIFHRPLSLPRSLSSHFIQAITENTILLVASATEYCYGMVDPIREISAIALEKGLPLHVDSCIGGFMLPWWGLLMLLASYPDSCHWSSNNWLLGWRNWVTLYLPLTSAFLVWPPCQLTSTSMALEPK